MSKTCSLALLSGDHNILNPYLCTHVCKPPLCHSPREYIQANSHSDKRGGGEAHWRPLLSALRRSGGVNHVSRLWGLQGLTQAQGLPWLCLGWETPICLYSPYPPFTAVLSLDSQEFLLLYLLRGWPALWEKCLLWALTCLSGYPENGWALHCWGLKWNASCTPCLHRTLFTVAPVLPPSISICCLD